MFPLRLKTGCSPDFSSLDRLEQPRPAYADAMMR
jgi:hypothetical protein